MLFQVNQTRVTFKVEKNQLSPPNSHPFTLWVQQHRYNTASIKSAGQPKSGKAFYVRRHSDPSSKMPYSFLFSFTWQVFFNLCMLKSWDLLIVHRAALTPWSKKGTYMEVKYIRPCAYTVPGSCKEHGSPSQGCRVSLWASKEKKNLWKFANVRK